MEQSDAFSDIINQNPFLNLLVRALFVFTRLDPSISGDTIKHNLDAISKVFSCINQMKKSVMDLVMFYQVEAQVSLNNFFSKTCLDYEAGRSCFKMTLSYLKFTIKLFKLDNP